VVTAPDPGHAAPADHVEQQVPAANQALRRTRHRAIVATKRAAKSQMNRPVRGQWSRLRTSGAGAWRGMAVKPGARAGDAEPARRIRPAASRAPARANRTSRHPGCLTGTWPADLWPAPRPPATLEHMSGTTTATETTTVAPVPAVPAVPGQVVRSRYESRPGRRALVAADLD